MKRIRKNWNYIIYSMVGIVLLFFTLATGTYGLPKVDKNIYAEAVKLDEKVNGFGFSKFSLKDYTVRFLMEMLIML